MLEPLLLDPDLMDDRYSGSSDVSSSRGNFGARVAARDGTCVMTGSPRFQACHIIPHAKGHEVHSEYLWNHSKSSFQAQYIIRLARHRGQVFVPPLEDINDTRNGILLSPSLHGPFGASEVAFLRVSY